MTKFILSAIAALAIVAPTVSHAQEVETSALGTCNLKADLEVKSLFIFLGGTSGEGYGRIKCHYSDGTVERVKVYIRTSGVGVGFGASNLLVHLAAGGLGIMDGGARALLGNYALARAGVAVGPVGGGFGTGLTANRNGFSIPLAAYAAERAGVEIAASFGGMEIYEAP